MSALKCKFSKLFIKDRLFFTEGPALIYLLTPSLCLTFKLYLEHMGKASGCSTNSISFIYSLHPSLSPLAPPRKNGASIHKIDCVACFCCIYFGGLFFNPNGLLACTVYCLHYPSVCLSVYMGDFTQGGE